jgi:hypothetical protein
MLLNVEVYEAVFVYVSCILEKIVFHEVPRIRFFTRVHQAASKHEGAGPARVGAFGKLAFDKILHMRDA